MIACSLQLKTSNVGSLSCSSSLANEEKKLVHIFGFCELFAMQQSIEFSIAIALAYYKLLTTLKKTHTQTVCERERLWKKMTRNAILNAFLFCFQFLFHLDLVLLSFLHGDFLLFSAPFCINKSLKPHTLVIVIT